MSKYCEEDKKILADLCAKYPILKIKGSSYNLSSNKKRAWGEITADYNSLRPKEKYRSEAQLKAAYLLICRFGDRESSDNKPRSGTRYAVIDFNRNLSTSESVAE
ncbi:Protein of unknown function [Gryllus bimaculatus]|nr:Protein of unknown function [Gryllus bimaculatus]